MYKKTITSLIVLTLLGSLFSTQAFAATETHISGENRYETAYFSFQNAWGNTTPSGMVIVSGESFPDSITAAALAGTLNYGLLLVNPNTIFGTYVDTFISNYQTNNFIIIGSTSSVSATVVSQMITLFSDRWGYTPNISRAQGANRQLTAEAICAAGGSTWGNTAIVVTGENFPDGLAVSPLANYKKYPIFLADASGNILASTRSMIASKCSKAIIIGSTSSVSATTENNLKSSLGASNVSRYSGTNRYQTSATVATLALSQGLTASNVGIATGENFPDGVAGAAGHGKRGYVMLLVNNTTTNYATSWLAGKVGSNLTMYGSYSTLNYSVIRAVRTPIATTSLLSWDLVGSGNKVNWYGGTTYQADFNAAASIWNNVRPSFQAIIAAPSGVTDKVQLKDYSNSADNTYATAGYTGSYKYIEFNTYEMNKITSPHRRAVCLHELGHAMGLGHNAAADVMYGGYNGMLILSVNDLASFDAAWARHGY